MPAADARQMGTKEFVQSRWAAHREAFRVGAFATPGGGPGFLAVDRLVQPPVFYAIWADDKDGVRALRGDLRDDAQARLPLDATAAAILSGDLPSASIPVHEALRLMGPSDGAPGELASLSVRRFADALGDVRVAARLPREGLEASEARRMAAAGLGALRARMDPAALEILSACDAFRWRDYSYFAAPGETGDVRRAAARHFPLFATFMVERPSVRRGIDAQVAEKHRTEEYLRSPEHAAKLAAPVERNGETRSLEAWMIADGRDPRAPWQLAEKAVRQAIQAGLGMDENGQPRVPNHVLANLRGVSWPTGGLPIDRIVSALGELPADWFPKTREDWDAFCDLTDTVGRLLPGLTGTPLRVLYEGCGGKWADLRERFVRAYADTRPPEGVDEAGAAMLEAGIDWEALAALPRGKVQAAAEAAVDRLGELPPGVARESVVEWASRRVAPPMDRAFLRNACTEVEEMAEAFARKVILPLAANEATRQFGRNDHPLAQQHHVAARASAAAVLLPGKSAVRLMEMTRTYVNRAALFEGAGADETTEAEKAAEEARKREAAERAAQAATMTSLGIDPTAPIPDDGWAPLCPIVQAPNGVFIVPLTDPRQLADEGRGWGNPHDGRRNADGSMGLGICVGSSTSYARRCQVEGQHILSFRELGGAGGASFTRLSCNQVAPLTPGSNKVDTLQHRGQGNGDVPERAERAWQWFKAAALNGEIKLNHEGIRERQAMARGKLTDEVELACGYEWRDRKRILKAMSPWGPLVGKRHRKMGVDEFAADAVVQEVARAIEPQMKAPEAAAPAMRR